MVFSRFVSAVLWMSLCALLGLAVGAMLGAFWLGGWIGAVLGVVANEMRDALRGNRFMTWLRAAHASDPGRAQFDLAPAPRDSGQWGELAYRVERLLRQRETVLAGEKAQLAEFLSAIEASPNGVLMLDSDDQIVWCNSVAADHFGLDPVRDHRQRVTNLLRSPGFVAYLQDSLLGDGADAIVMPAPQGHGTLSVLLRHYGQGMRLVLSQDITERLRNEAMRRDFVANVSHEIRTPLTVLAGFVETLTNLPLTEVERSRVLSLMTQQTQRMQSLVADLLALAQLEGSPRPAVDTWVPLALVVDQAEVEALGLSKGRHTLVFPALVGSDQEGVQLAGSQGELMSALTNLVSNAVRYTPDGGCITVSWSRRPDGAGVLAVSDNGPGIAREHLPRLTERFYRVDGSRSRETGGTGLGLSIVKHIVQRHSAELEIDSEVGRGSTFRIIFPPARMRQAPRVALAVASSLQPVVH